MRDQHVWRFLNETLDNAKNLLAGFAFAKHDFRKSLSCRPRMIYSSETNIFVVQIAN